MIMINGKKFAENDGDMTDSLFQHGGTCVGYAKRYKRQIVLSNIQKERIAVINKHGVLCCATKQPEGGYWYSFATVKEIGRFIKYSDEANVGRDLSVSNSPSGYCYK